MRLRQLVLACGLASLIASPLASALGLGEVKLNSTLNQPLSAEIQLLDTRDLTAEQILVSLASPADFERNGVDRLYFYTEFKFDIDLENPAGPVVRVTSRNPVREPYLNFLVEARWTAGRLLREYTLLMDLPTYDDERTAAPVSVPRSTPDVPVERQSTQGRVTRPATTTTDEAPVRRERITATAGDGEYVIKPNDTLWEIALAVRPDNSVSVHQAMVALYEANPEAFINGNISRLKEGKVLRIPDATQMSSISKSEAANQFVQLESGMGAQLSASSRTSSDTAESSELSGRVTLAASNARNTSTTGQGSGADDGRGKALESELASTLEELDRVKSENTELTSRVQDLESQIQTMEKMLQVSDEKMRSLQVSAEKTNQEQKAEPVASKPEATKPVEEITASEASVSSAAAVAKPEAKPAQQPAKPKPAVKPMPAPEPTLVDQLIANAPWIGVGIVLIGGLIGFGVYRRRKQAQADQDQLDDDMMSHDEPLNFDSSMDDQDHFDQLEPEVPQDNLDLDSDLDDDVNPADKADIYIAYGQLDKAENLLLKGLDKDPKSTDIQMKLLEVYSQQRDVSKFDKYYAALIPVAAPALLSRASELRSHIPGAGDFDMPDLAPDLSDEPAVKAQQVVSLDDLELDLEDSLDFEEPKSKPLQQPSSEQDDDFSIELDLTEDVDAQDTVMRGSPEPELNLDDGLGEELALDFDLDDEKSDETLDLDFDLESQADDIGDISAALDGMDDDQLPDDIQMPASVESEPSLASVKTVAQDLELADDDFNLDLDSDTVDLAALDSEMSSLDTDFALDDITEESVDLDTTDLDNELSMDDGLDELVLDDASDVDIDLALDDLDADEVELGSADSELEEEISFDSDDDLSFDLEETIESEDHDEVSSFDTSFDQETLPEELPEELSSEEPMNEDALFEQALSDIDDNDVALTEFDQPAEQQDDSDDLDFLAEADEAATKLDLARAYIDMGDMAGARDILSEVVSEGTSEQRQEAEDLLSRIDA